MLQILKQAFNTKNHKHEIVYVKGFGYRCKWCNKTKQECRKDMR